MPDHNSTLVFVNEARYSLDLGQYESNTVFIARPDQFVVYDFL